MNEIFGVSLTTIATVMLVLFGIVAVVVVALALKNRIMFKLGVRNIPKRPAQTALIVLGLMLSTVLITAAFSTGDTVVYTIRSIAADALGNTDEIITAPNAETVPGSGYFNYARFDEISVSLLEANVDGILPVIREQVPLINAGQFLSAPSVTLFAPGPQYVDYTNLTTTEGDAVTLDDLGPNEVYIDESTADDLKAESGDQLLLYVGSQKTPLTLAGIVEGASSESFSFVLMPLDRAQSIFKEPGRINAIYISNSGGALDGAKFSDEVEERLQVPLGGIGLEIDTVKKDTLDQADLAGSALTSIFVGFGLFSIAAGVLLIFLIFVMLAAARKSEMGMARAVGTKRSQLVQMFLFEGVVYDLMAAIVGVGLGVLVTYAIAGIMASVVQGAPIEIAVHVEPRSLIVAFTLGILVTFVTVAVSAWRVSRLNIVRAIRDIPEPAVQKLSRRMLAMGIAVGVFGVMLTLTGMGSKQSSPLYLGVALIIIGVALIARWRGARERLVFTLAGVALLGWSLLPINVFEAIFGDMKMGIEMFFLTGMMMVLGAVWVVSYNLDIVLRILVSVLGRLRSAAPILRAAMAYPMKNRLRTGLTLAMFSLVIFTIVFMSVVISANTAVLSDSDSFAGGYDIQANVSYINSIPDIHQAVADKGFNSEDFQFIAGTSTIPLKIRQVNTESQEQEFKEYALNGVDDVYLDTNAFEFALISPGYDSAADVWQALLQTPGLAVISADAVPSRESFGISVGGPEFRLEDVWLEDEGLDGPIQVQVMVPGLKTTDGEPLVANLTVIAVLDVVSFNYGVYTSQQTIDQASPVPIPTTTYLFKLSEGVDAGQMADDLESAFSVNGMQATSIKDLLRKISQASFTINTLLQGFMSLGLVIGIAALGVISTRAVVERRHEIGILRAIGFRRSSVQAAFLLESSIVALLGILIGTVLALASSYQVLDSLKDTIEGLEFQMPWVEVGIIAGVSWIASLLMTIIPAWQASKIYPAEALRYE